MRRPFFPVALFVLPLFACSESDSHDQPGESNTSSHEDSDLGHGTGSGSQSATSSDAMQSSEVEQAMPMALEYLPVGILSNPFAFESVDLTGWPAREFPPVHIFGTAYQGRTEPTLMFDLLKVGTPVIAPFDGHILEVRDQPESCDSEMYLLPASNDQENHLSIDHVVPAAAYRLSGAEFHAGDVLGTAPAWECDGEIARLELMVVYQSVGEQQPTKARCPLALAAPSRADTFAAAIRDVMESWNSRSPMSSYTEQELSNGACAAEYVPLQAPAL